MPFHTSNFIMVGAMEGLFELRNALTIFLAFSLAETIVS